MPILQGLFGPPEVEKLKARKDISGLIKALNYQKVSPVRVEAAGALGSLRDQAAIDPLCASLKDSSPIVRQQAAWALEQIASSRAVESLVAALADPHPPVRQTAASALGAIGDRRAVEPLVHTLQDGDRLVIHAAALALGKIGDPGAFHPLLALFGHPDLGNPAANALVQLRSPDLEALIARLDEASDLVRTRATWALEQLGWRPPMDELGARFFVQRKYWDRCVEVGAPAILPLIEELSSEDAERRGAAAQALGQIGDQRAIAPLVGILSDQNYSNRDMAATALDRLGWTPASAAEAVRYWIAKRRWEDAARLGAPAVEVLSTELSCRESEILKKVIETLGLIGIPEAVEALTKAIDERGSTVREDAYAALVKIGAPAVGVLLERFAHEDQAVFLPAREALVKIGKPAIPSIVPGLKEAGPRDRAAYLLRDLGWQPTTDQYGAYYWIAMNDLEKCAALGPAALESLSAIVQDKHENVRARAAIALGKIGDARCVDPLIAVVNDTDDGLRLNAAKALVELYQSGRLDAGQKQRILEKRDSLTQHADSHTDYSSRYSDCSHDDHHDVAVSLPV